MILVKLSEGRITIHKKMELDLTLPISDIVSIQFKISDPGDVPILKIFTEILKHSTQI
jgi:hypothetical protein